MGKYKVDLTDYYHNFFTVLKIQNSKFGVGESEIKEMFEQYVRFIEQEIYPTRTVGDHEGVSLTKEGVNVPKCFQGPHRAYYDNGWFALGFPEEIGGMPVPTPVSTSATAILCGANLSYSMYPGLSRSALNCLLEVGKKEVIAPYIENMMKGKWGGTMCLTEPSAGSDVGALKTTATPIGNGKYKIKGTKIFISSGDNDLYENIIHLVLARTPGGAPGTKGISLFVVPKIRINTDGSLGAKNDVHCAKLEEKMGLHAQATCVLNFGDENNCEGHLLGEEFAGMMNMFVMMNEARLLCGLQGEGQASLAYEMSKLYVHQRVQFGKEIIHHDDVKRLMLKMRSGTRGMRALMIYTAHLFDQDKKTSIAEIELLTPICKAYGTELAFELSVDAIQVHGGYGFCTEYEVEQFTRDLKITTIYEGTTGIQANDFVNRKLRRDNCAAMEQLLQKVEIDLTLLDAKYKLEKAHQVMKQNLHQTQEIINCVKGWFKDKKEHLINQNAVHLLMYFSRIVVGWRLALNLHHASSEILNERQVDYFQYIQQHISQNQGAYFAITQFDTNLATLEL